MSDSPRSRLAFIDWMKCIGMILIVYGHTGGSSVFAVSTRPFNQKQLGVAFFVFVLGYSLAKERRPPLRVLFNRLFDIYLFGVACAVVLGVIMWFTKGDVNESNFLPFCLGANVLINDFPANPTTWYIGTYIHLILIWLLVLQRTKVRPSWILASAIVEIGVRVVLMNWAGDYIAYMLFTNWMTLLLAGMYVGQAEFGDVKEHRWRGIVPWSLVGLAVSIGWFACAETLEVTLTNPFGRIPITNGLVESLMTSVSISVLYLLYTLVCFQLARRLGPSRVVSFFARNTLLIFILHMPLVYFLTPYLYALPLLTNHGIARITVNMLIFFVSLACVSEAILRCARPAILRNHIWDFLVRRGLAPSQTTSP